MRHFPLFTIALILTLVYLAIVVKPLVPLVVFSKAIAHAVTGQCTGDCATCGCPPERSADHNCCCWRQRGGHDHHRVERPQISCCGHKGKDDRPVSSWRASCDCNGYLASWSTENEQLCFRFPVDPVYLRGNDLPAGHRDRLNGRHGDPPDPPPKLPLLS